MKFILRKITFEIGVIDGPSLDRRVLICLEPIIASLPLNNAESSPEFLSTQILTCSS